MTTTTTTNSQRGRHSKVQQRRRESTKETEGWARREGLGGPTERKRETRRERRKHEREGPGGGKTRGRQLRRESGRGGESTNEETNALRSKEHACGSGRRECCKEERRRDD